MKIFPNEQQIAPGLLKHHFNQAYLFDLLVFFFPHFIAKLKKKKSGGEKA